MATNVREFNRRLRAAFRTQVRGQAARFVRAVALEVLSRTVLRTPVDTGRLRGNWQLSVASPSVEELAAEANPSLVTQAGLAALGNYTADDLGTPVIIQNNVEYASFVEFGTTRMPPRPMLTAALEEVAAIFPSVDVADDIRRDV